MTICNDNKISMSAIFTSQDINKIFALALHIFLNNKCNSSKIRELTRGIKRGYLSKWLITFCILKGLLVYFVSLKDTTCETRKNVFYFTLKALSLPEIIKF